MRPALVLALSLALAGVLLAMNVAVYRSRSAPAAPAPERKITLTTKRLLRSQPSVPAAPVPMPVPAFHWSTLKSTDYATYAANLRAFGCPERTLRDILLPDIEQHYAGQRRAVEEDAADHFWETADVRDARQRQREAQLWSLELEKRALIRQLLGADASAKMLEELRKNLFTDYVFELLLGFTDWARTEQLLGTYVRFEEEIRAWRTAADDLVLDEDQPKLQALRDRFEAELARDLSALELVELQCRLVTIAGMDHLNRRDGVNVSGVEVREIARLHAVTHDVLAKVLNLENDLYPDALKQRAEAAFTELLRRQLGAERFADAERAKDSEYLDLLHSTENRGVSKTALVQALEARRAALEQARDIRDDQKLTATERAVLLTTLRAQTTQALTRALGPTAAAAYFQQHGVNFTNALSPPITRDPAPVK